MIRHLASIAEIVDDVGAAVGFYRDVLGLVVEHDVANDYATASIPGILHFGIWSRKAAAESTFGSADDVDRVPLGFTVGFEVDDVEAASQAMASKSWRLVQAPKKEPWEQVTSRFFSPSGALCEVSETPWARQVAQNVQAESRDEQS